uniref:SFRICE_027306 n=1 Tax=Spodoptera frugiperda TaxID=7108 RepID=A0A2H1V182_SPOFR
MLRHEWAGSTGVIPRPHRKPTEVTGGPIPLFPIFSIPDSRTTTLKSNPQKAGNALVTPLVFQVSMGGGDFLPSGDTSTRLPQRHAVYTRRDRQKCSLRHVMPLYNVHPLFTICVLSPILRATTEKHPSNSLPDPGMEPETPCSAVALTT